jgi:hypothetical protein
MGKPHILAQAAETNFWQFKEQVTYNFKIKNNKQFNGNEDLSTDKTYDSC